MLKPPETPQEKPNSAMNYDVNLNNIDDLLGELSVPVQDFTPKTENQPENNGIYDPVTGGYENQEQIILSPEENQRSGERAARFFDSIISMGAQTIARADTREPYKADDGDIEDIAKAWAEYTKDKNFNIPPWATLAMLYVTVYLPKITKAFNDRRLNELSDRITKLEEEKDQK